ncbi:MAG: twin-arginine translocase subunit TatC [Planctomycetota bacterium]
MPMDQSAELAPAKDTDVSMPLGDHLEELRGRILLAGAGVIVAAAATFFYVYDLIGWLAQPLMQAQDAMGFPTQTLVTEPTAGFTSVILPVGIIAAVLLASPWVIYQAWKFISVGLYHHERKAVYILTPFSTLMTTLAVLFSYYVLLPVSLMFFLQMATYYPTVELSQPNPVMSILLEAYGKKSSVDLSEVAASEVGSNGLTVPVFADDPVDAATGEVWFNLSEGKLKIDVGDSIRIVGMQSDRLISPLPALGHYVRFAAMMMFGVTLAFQVPVVMLVAGWTNLFDPRSIASLRKYALLIAFAAGALLTPADATSMFVLAIPLYLLFELGLLMMKVTYKGDPPPPDEL